MCFTSSKSTMEIHIKKGEYFFQLIEGPRDFLKSLKGYREQKILRATTAEYKYLGTYGFYYNLYLYFSVLY